MRNNRRIHVLNEAYQDKKLYHLFNINGKKHIGLDGALSDALCKDGADFANAFPIEWDKITEDNVRFYVDNQMDSYIPRTDRLYGRPQTNNDNIQTGRYDLDAVVKNAVDTKKQKSLISKYYRKFKDIRDFAEEEGKDMGIDVTDIVKNCNTVRDQFLQKVTHNQGNAFINSEDYKVVKNWRDWVVGGFFSGFFKNGDDVEFDNIIDEYISKDVDGKGKRKISDGINYNVAKGSDFLGQYNRLSDLRRVSFNDFARCFCSHEYYKIFDDSAMDIIVKVFADIFGTDDESKIESIHNSLVNPDADERLRYSLENRSFLFDYKKQRKEDLDSITNMDKSEKTRKLTSEWTALSTTYRECVVNAKTGVPSKVYALIDEVYKKAEPLTEGMKGVVIRKLVNRIFELGDEDYIENTGDFSVLFLLGADLQIQYVLLSAYLDPFNRNIIGTYRSKGNTEAKVKYIYGWSKNRPLTTVEDRIKERLKTLDYSDDTSKQQGVSINLISDKEILSDMENIHCAMMISGAMSNYLTKDEIDERTFNKIVLTNLQGDQTKGFKRDVEFDRIRRKGDWLIKGDINSMKRLLNSKDVGIKYTERSVKGNVVLQVSSKYTKKLRDISDYIGVSSLSVNSLFDELDELNKVYNMFVNAPIENRNFIELYFKVFCDEYDIPLDDISTTKKTSILQNMSTLYYSIEDTPERKIVFDSAIVDNDIFKTQINKKSETLDPIYPKILERMGDVTSKLNKIFTDNNVSLMIDTPKKNPYWTLGQSFRNYSEKVINRRNRQRFTNWTDREKEYLLNKVKSATRIKNGSDEYDKLSSAWRRIYTNIDKLQNVKLNIGKNSKDVFKSMGKTFGTDFGSKETLYGSILDFIATIMTRISDLDNISHVYKCLNELNRYIGFLIDSLSALSSEIGNDGSSVDDDIRIFEDWRSEFIDETKDLESTLAEYDIIVSYY